MITSEELGKRIMDARRAAQMTQVDLADVLDLDRSAIARIENGNRKVDSLELYALSEAVGCPVEELLEPQKTMAVLFRDQETSRSPQTNLELMWAQQFFENYKFLKAITGDE